MCRCAHGDVRCWDVEYQKGKWGLKELLTAKNAKNAAKSAKRSVFMAKGTKKQSSRFHVLRRAPGLRFSRLGPMSDRSPCKLVWPPRSCEEVMIVKTGMEEPKKLGLACGLIAVAGMLTIRWVDSGFVQKAEMNGSGVLRPSAGSSRALVSKTWVDPTLNIGALRDAEAARYEGSERDIFHVALDLAPHGKTEKWDPEKTVTRHEETVTPFPLTFFGFSRRGDARSIFLLAGDDVFIAREGDVVDRRYKIVRVTPKSVEVEDLMKQETQKLWLKDG